MKWISVKDKLPNENIDKSTYVLICSVDKDVFEVEFDKKKFYTYGGCCGRDEYPLEEITHWMLLPEPPKE